MTDDRTALIALLEKASDAELLSEILAFMANRLMALDVEALCNAAPRRCHHTGPQQYSQDAMPSFKTRRPVPFTRTQMFDLVADIEKYPQYLPLCEDLRINSRDERATTTVLNARMDVVYQAFKESFTTQVTLDPDAKCIGVTYLDGPFSHLDSTWDFMETPTGCNIDFFISYEFKSALLGVVMGSMFERAFNKFSQSFEERAQKIYATPSSHD